MDDKSAAGAYQPDQPTNADPRENVASVKVAVTAAVRPMIIVTVSTCGALRTCRAKTSSLSRWIHEGDFCGRAGMADAIAALVIASPSSDGGWRAGNFGLN